MSRHPSRPRAWRQLIPHPSAVGLPAVRVAAATDLETVELVLAFELRGDLSTLAIPAPALHPARRDRLWEHSCLEAFVGHSSGGGYLEVNLSPSGDWALWSFAAYRTGMKEVPIATAPRVAVARTAAGLRLESALPRAVLESKLGPPPYRVGLTAVLEDAAGRRSHWALGHEAGQLDFHRREGWSVAVYPPARA